MKHIYSISKLGLYNVIIVLLFCSSSCTSQTQEHKDKEIEHYLIGTWYSIFQDEPQSIEDSGDGSLETQLEIETTLKVFAQNQYYKENKFVSDEELRITYRYDRGSFTMKFIIASNGTWSVKNNKVLFDTHFPSLKIKFKGSDASNAAEKELVQLYRNEVPTSIKKELLENGSKPSSVSSITKSTMKLIDSEGLLFTYKRMSTPPKEFDASLLPNDNFSKEQLAVGTSVFERLAMSGSKEYCFLGTLIPKSDTVLMYDNPKLSGNAVHTMKIPKKGKISARAFIVFDVINDTNCGYHYKVLSKTGHFGWISGCSDLDTKWIDSNQAITKSKSVDYKRCSTVKDLMKVYN